jgi:hypothetical protein
MIPEATYSIIFYLLVGYGIGCLHCLLHRLIRYLQFIYRNFLLPG